MFGKYEGVYIAPAPGVLYAENSMQRIDPSITIRKGKREHYVFRFNNGFGASIIRGTAFSHPTLWELALILWEKDGFEWKIANDTPRLGDYVFPGLTEPEVIEILEKIEAR